MLNKYPVYFLGDFMSTFTFQFTEEQTNYILNLIAEKPFKEVHVLVSAIQQQAQQQMNPAPHIQQTIDEQGLTQADIVPNPPKKK